MKNISQITPVITFPEEQLNKNCKPIEGIQDENGCVICYSHRTKDGKYPRAMRKNKDWRLNRYIFSKWNEEIPEGEIIRHTCDNTFCINPEHLIRGTHKDNADDKIERNRQVKGSACPNAKLNEAIIYYIRFISKESNKELAKKYKVSQTTIYLIRANKTWKHVKLIQDKELAA